MNMNRDDLVKFDAYGPFQAYARTAGLFLKHVQEDGDDLDGYMVALDADGIAVGYAWLSGSFARSQKVGEVFRGFLPRI
jgi:hypothetical protein